MYLTISNFIIEHHKHSFRTYISVRIMWRWTSRISSSTTGWDTFRSRWTFVSLASNWTFFPGRWCSAWRGAPSRTGATPGRRGTSRDRYKETIRRFPQKGNLRGGNKAWDEHNIIPSIWPAATTPLIIISASPTILVMIRTCTAASAPTATISFLPTVPVTIVSASTSAATSLPVIPVPVFIPMPKKISQLDTATWNKIVHIKSERQINKGSSPWPRTAASWPAFWFWRCFYYPPFMTVNKNKRSR